VCCSVLQYVAVCCSMLQYVAVCCSVLQSVAVCCSVLQYVAVCCSMLQYVAVCCSVLQCVAVCCNMLQCVLPFLCTNDRLFCVVSVMFFVQEKYFISCVGSQSLSARPCSLCLREVWGGFDK